VTNTVLHTRLDDILKGATGKTVINIFLQFG